MTYPPTSTFSSIIAHFSASLETSVWVFPVCVLERETQSPSKHMSWAPQTRTGQERHSQSRARLEHSKALDLRQNPGCQGGRAFLSRGVLFLKKAGMQHMGITKTLKGSRSCKLLKFCLCSYSYILQEPKWNCFPISSFFIIFFTFHRKYWLATFICVEFSISTLHISIPSPSVTTPSSENLKTALETFKSLI